jgi:hypothetical protein
MNDKILTEYQMNFHDNTLRLSQLDLSSSIDLIHKCRSVDLWNNIYGLHILAYTPIPYNKYYLLCPPNLQILLIDIYDQYNVCEIDLQVSSSDVEVSITNIDYNIIVRR